PNCRTIAETGVPPTSSSLPFVLKPKKWLEATLIPFAALELGVVHLAAACFWQIRYYFNELRNHVLGQSLGAEGEQLIGIDSPLLEDNEGLDSLSKHTVRDANDSGVADDAALKKYLFDLGRADAES